MRGLPDAVRRSSSAADEQHRAHRVDAHHSEEVLSAELQHVPGAVVDAQRASVDASVVVEDVDRLGAERRRRTVSIDFSDAMSTSCT